jgi:type II secretory pathway pseudopilin PulG
MRLRKTEIVVGLASIILTGIVVSYWRASLASARDSQAILAAENADKALIASLRSALPPGSTLAQTRKELEDRKFNVPVYFNNELLLSQGTEPSQVWYCGPISRYVSLTFLPSPDGRPQLKGIERETRGEDCL